MRLLIFTFVGIAALLGGFGASADDCTPVEDSHIEPDPDDDTPPDFIDFNICEGVHALDLGHNFLLAVHSAAPESTHVNHETWLLESSDGASWNVVNGFESFLGSVPEVITRGSEIYLFNPGKMRAYDLESGTVRGASAIITTAEGETVQYVDPSAILDDQNRIVLFFLNSSDTPIGQDPAGGPDPKDFDSAVEVEGSLGTEFILTDGHRIQIQGSDPDIFFDGEQFILYISRGQSTLAFISETLEGAYFPIGELDGDSFLTHQGGVPAGHYDEETMTYWTYVHSSSTSGTVVRLAVHDSMTRELGDEAFEITLSYEDLGYAEGHRVESPSFAVNTLVPEPNAQAAGFAALLALTLLGKLRHRNVLGARHSLL